MTDEGTNEGTDDLAAVPPATARSVPGAVLLNLTGLGLGYGYLRRWWLAGAAITGTVALLVADGVTGSRTHLWVAAALVLAVLLAAHAGLLARRHPGPTGPRPVLAGSAAVVLVACGVAGYGVLARAATTDGEAAMRGGDCARAVERFDAAAGVYRLGADVPTAEAGRQECTAFLRAADARERGDHAAAVRTYRGIQKAFPRSVLASAVHRELAETYVAQARDFAEPLDIPAAREAVDALRVVRDEFGDTPAAGRVPETVATLFAAAGKPFARGQACPRLPVLDYFAGLDTAVAPDVVAAADAQRADALLDCGLQKLRAGDAATAAPILDNYATDYPKHARYAWGKAAQINARVAARAKVRLPVPPPLGAHGNVRLTFYNDSRKVLHILVGGGTAHDFTLQPCKSCPALNSSAADTCGPGRALPSATVLLDRRAAYYWAVDNPAAIASWDTYPLDMSLDDSYICVYYDE
jgi:tetratricopeptide repeat protein